MSDDVLTGRAASGYTMTGLASASADQASAPSR
jgi:hypothetical protein